MARKIATQQSELIDQRKNDKPPKDFQQEGGGMGMDPFAGMMGM